jgi:hypothetical protein
MLKIVILTTKPLEILKILEKYQQKKNKNYRNGLYSHNIPILKKKKILKNKRQMMITPAL